MSYVGRLLRCWLLVPSVTLLFTGCSWFDLFNSNDSMSIRTIWSTVVSARSVGTPTLAGNRVIQAFDDRIVRAFNVSSGKLIWQTTPADQGIWPIRALVGPDSIVVVTAASAVFGFAVATGERRWQYVTSPDSTRGGEPGSVAFKTLAINASATIIAVPAWGSTVAAIRMSDGARLWHWAAIRDHNRPHGAQGAVWCGNTVFVSLWRYIDERGVPSEHSIVALDGTTGRELWTTVLPYSPIIVSANGWMECDETRLWATTMSGPLWALTRSDGTVVLNQPRDRGYLNNSGPRRVGTRVFADAGLRQQVVSYAADNGAELWRSSMIGSPNYRMVGGTEFLWLSNTSFLYIFRVSDGRLVVTQKLNDKGIAEAPLLLTERDAILPMENGIARVVLRNR